MNIGLIPLHIRTLPTHLCVEEHIHLDSKGVHSSQKFHKRDYLNFTRWQGCKGGEQFHGWLFFLKKKKKKKKISVIFM